MYILHNNNNSLKLVLEAMSTLEGALRTMQKKQQHLQEEHEKGENNVTY